MTLRQRVLRASWWSLGGHGLSHAIRLGSNLIMTRLLVPEMFGIMAIVTTVMVILSLLSDVGLGPNIVQSRRGDDPEFLDTAWVVQIARGLILWLAALVLSVALHVANQRGLLPAGSVYASEVLPLVIAVSALGAVISGFQSTKMATAFRQFDQRRLVQIELISQLAGLAVMVVIGAVTRSIWALVAAGLVSALVTTVLSHAWMTGHSNRFRWEAGAFRELISFGKWIYVSSAIGVFASTGDRLLLGGFLEAEAMGMYAIAALMVRAIEGALGKVFMNVSLPAFSEVARENPARLREVYYKMRVPSDLALLFIAGLLFSSGQLLIDLLYDPRYSAAGGMLQVLGLSLFSFRYGISHQIYLAVGEPRYQAILSVVRFISLYSLVPALYYLLGPEAAVWGIALHTLATVPFVYAFNARFRANDLRRELLVLVALPVGFLCGWVAIQLQA